MKESCGCAICAFAGMEPGDASDADVDLVAHGGGICWFASRVSFTELQARPSSEEKLLGGRVSKILIRIQ